MRRVCGWTPASSAATEITNTAGSYGLGPGRSATATTSAVHAEVGPRRLVRQGRELAQQVALLAREPLRHGHLDGDQQVAEQPAGGAGHPAAAHPEGAAVLGAGRDLERHRPVQGRHLQLGAERGLGEGHRHGDGQVVAAAAEQRVLADVDLDDQVPGGRAGLAGLALALEADGGAVADPGGDADLQLAGADLAAPAAAVGARVVDHRAAALAGRAGAGQPEQALVAGDGAAAVAGRAGPRQRARPGAGAVAHVAGRRPGELERDGGAAHRLLEAEGDLAVDVPPTPGGLLAPAEEVAEQVAQATAQVLDADPAPEPAREAAAEPARERAGADQAAGLVVLGALLGVGQHAVGPADLLEALLRGPVAGVGVRVVLLGELPVGLLDVRRRGVLGNAEDGVEVLLQILRVVHGYLATFTIAGRRTLPRSS